MAEKKYLLEIVTPEKKIFSENDVEFSVFPGSEGELGILADHAPLLSRLSPGEIRITRNKVVECLAIDGGFLEVRKNEVSVITETAEFAKDINIDRAKAEKESAESQVKRAQSPAEFKEADLRLKKAEARIKVAGKATPA